MSTPFALSSLPTELQLHIFGFLPWWDLYALILTNRHLYNFIGRIKMPSRTTWTDDWSWTDDTIQDLEDSAWAKDVDALFCNGCYSILPAHLFDDDHLGARKDLDLALKKKFSYRNYYRCCSSCRDYANYPASAADWNEKIAYERTLYGE